LREAATTAHLLKAPPIRFPTYFDIISLAINTSRPIIYGMNKSKFAAGIAAASFAVFARAAVDPSTFDLSVRPQDDFFRYADGTWIKENPIPPEYSRWGSFNELIDQNTASLNKICEAAAAKGSAGTPVERMVGDFYASGMDEAAANAAGAKPLQPELDRISAIKTPGDVMMEIARLHSMGISAGFHFSSGADAKNSDMELAQLRQDGLGLPNRDYYINDDEKSKKLREEYVQHVSTMLQLLGDPPEAAAAGAQTVLRLETVLATNSLSPEVLRNPYASYHKMAVGDIAKYTGGVDWPGYFHAVGAPAFDQVNFQQPEFFKAFSAQLASEPVQDWQIYLRWHLVHDLAPYLSDAFDKENFHFYDEILTGTTKELPRWKRVTNETDSDIGEALGQLYVAQYFPPEAKAQVLKLVGNLRAALRSDLATLDWMDEATRRKAIVKLDAFTVKMGYPDTWRDYSSLTVDRGPFVLNVIRANEFETHRVLTKIGKPVDRAEWHMTPPTVNAYYSPQRNEIVFPAGILQPPFFDPKADDAVNYGGIGAVIGHEMTHGFDDQGRQYDPHGNLADWWSVDSANKFKVRSAGIVRQFNDYTVLDGVHLIGERTQGENIADLGGLKIAYAALEKDLEGKPRGKIDGFTPEQRFFLSFASIWRGSIRPEALRLRVKTDPHSPAEFRVNGPLSNLDEFAAAFDIPEGSPMRRSATDRVTIW
jgi:predicted metalloendopeptidase